MEHSAPKENWRRNLRRELYGRSNRPSITSHVLLASNVFIIILSLAGLVLGTTPEIRYIEFTFGILFALEYLLRFSISRHKGAFIFRMVNMLDLLVIASLLATALVPSVAFLKILRTIQILRAYKLLGRRFDQHNEYVHRNFEILSAVVNIVVFLVFMSTVVLLQQQHINEDINSYIDALYFTIAAVTTTGFGDIVVHGTYGKALAIVIMVFGVTLFFRLVKSIFVPRQLYHICPSCGHDTHDLRAHFCNQCGHKIKNHYRQDRFRKHKDDF